MQEEKQSKTPSTSSPDAKPETPQTTQQGPRETIPEPDRTCITSQKDIYGRELKQSNR
jgi:hypothetical protein